MATKKSSDQYVNVIKKKVTMSAVNTAEFEEIEVGLNLFDKIGLLIHRISYYPSDYSWSALVSAADAFVAGIVGSNQISTLNADERSVLDVMSLDVAHAGTPANFEIHNSPIIHDFSTFPGGGLLVPPKPLYAGVDTADFGAAGEVTVVLHFTIKQLADADYLELIETFRFFD